MGVELNLIVACERNGGIGFRGGLPWEKHFKEDMANFRRLTMGHGVLMGRRTWESLRGPLPGRKNYVLSGSLSFGESEGISVYGSIDQALRGAELDGCSELWVIGGEQLYNDVLANYDVTHIWITRIDKQYPHDCSFPISKFNVPEIEMAHVVALPCTNRRKRGVEEVSFTIRRYSK